MLTIKNLSVTIQGKEVLKNIDMQFSTGKNYCVLGQNGSGKSSLALTIMGHPKYEITTGDILVDKKAIQKLSSEERAKLGVFLAFQHIPEIKGVKVFEFLRSIYDAKHGTTTSFLQFKKIIEPIMLELSADKEFLWRDLNVGFSGGERRKLEILQLKILEPTYIFLDEIDSGLDVDAFKSIAQILAKLNNGKNSLIIITHLFKIAEYIPIDHIYILEKGSIKTEGDQKLIEKIKKEGFN